MENQKAKIILDQAEAHFDIAQEGLCKPEEDVVHYSVCRHAFKSIHKYLSGFLLKHGVDVKGTSSLEALQNRCSEFESRFKELNLSPLYHANDEEDVWMGMATAQEFFELAQQTRDIVNPK